MIQIKNYISKIEENIQSNKSIFYYSIIIVLVFGLLFFISSKRIFNNNVSDVRSTLLNEMQTNNTLNVKILSREYNPVSKLVEFIVYAEDLQNIENKDLIFELREQQTPNLKLETRHKKIGDNYYIVFAQAPKNWKVLSLSLGYKNDLDISIDEDNENIKNSNDSLNSIIRIYSDINDIKQNNLLKEKKSELYLSEITNIEIKFIEDEIANSTTQIDEGKNKISDANSKIVELENKKKYQTESEQNSTDISIQKLKNLKETTNSFIEKESEKVKELNSKIEKLNQKHSDFKV